MPASCDVIVFFPIYGKFGVIRKLDSGCIVCQSNMFIISNLLPNKNWKQN